MNSDGNGRPDSRCECEGIPCSASREAPLLMRQWLGAALDRLCLTRNPPTSFSFQDMALVNPGRLNSHVGQCPPELDNEGQECEYGSSEDSRCQQRQWMDRVSA